jgi:hypothetical protein
MYEEYQPELTALIGRPAYEKLAEMCASRAALGLVARHPASPPEA